jgi:hypothetical protein
LPGRKAYFIIVGDHREASTFLIGSGEPGVISTWLSVFVETSVLRNTPNVHRTKRKNVTSFRAVSTIHVIVPNKSKQAQVAQVG